MGALVMYLKKALGGGCITRVPTKDEVLDIIRTVRDYKDIDEDTFRPLFSTKKGTKACTHKKRKCSIGGILANLECQSKALYRDLEVWPMFLGSDNASIGSDANSTTPESMMYTARARVYITNKLWDQMNEIPKQVPTSITSKVFTIPPELRQKIFAYAVAERDLLYRLEIVGFRYKNSPRAARECLLRQAADNMLDIPVGTHQVLDEDIEQVWRILKKFITEDQDFDNVMAQDIRFRDAHNKCCAEGRTEHYHGYTVVDWCYGGEGHLFCTCCDRGACDIRGMFERALERLQEEAD